MKSHSESYKNAGVDITAGYRAVELMKENIARTKTSEVFSDIGGFGGMVLPDLTGIKNPVLVSGTDGVGTKLKIAFALNRHDTIGIDCVAMSVNDVICAGARPLFFLDYIAVGKNNPEVVAQIVKGVAEGCVQAGVALIGGETAEMPGIYSEGEYDLAGFAVGLADKDKIIDKSKIKAGDIVIALASSGHHSNGFSLTRKIFENYDLKEYIHEFQKTLGEELLIPTRIYVKPVLAALKDVELKGISHITGGGFYENIPRVLPEGLSVKIEKSVIKTPAIFEMIRKAGNIDEHDMFNTYNMGVGMCIVTDKNLIDKALEIFKSCGENAYIIGEVINGSEGIIIC